MATLPSPPQQMIEEELERLAASDALRRAPSHLRLLRYLVAKRIAGDSAAMREAAIALDVFRRDPATYDPQVDPIVRVNIGRLRERLESHYANFDRPPKLRIVLPKGTYAPEFIADPATPFVPSGIAVLRTRNQTGRAGLDTWCEAIADRLTDALAQAGLARVVARGSVEAAEAKVADAVAIGRQLGVQWLIEPVAAQDTEKQLRFVVRLLSAADGAVRWVEQRARPDDERYQLADRIVDAAVARACESLAEPVHRRSGRAPLAALPGARRAELEAANLLLAQRTLQATDEAIALAQGVTRVCPDSSAAWATLAATWYSRLTFLDRDPLPLVASTREAIARALALDPEEPVALRTEAILACKYDFDVPRAEALYARVLRMLPNYTSARLNYAEALWLQGRFDEALAETNMALIYDPLSAAVRMARGDCLCRMRRHDEARQEWAVFRATGEVSPWGMLGTAVNEMYAGHHDVAATLCDQAIARFPELPAPRYTRGLIHASAGDMAAAVSCERACLERAPHFSPTQRAQLAALLHDKQAVLDLLARGCADRDLHFLYAGINPEFEWLAGDPDFVALLRQGGVPAWRGLRTDPALD
jgi:tetratricopeptide (TPR) repeat protein